MVGAQAENDASRPKMITIFAFIGNDFTGWPFLLTNCFSRFPGHFLVDGGVEKTAPPCN